MGIFTDSKFSLKATVQHNNYISLMIIGFIFLFYLAAVMYNFEK